MSLIRSDERAVVAAVAALTDCNPFLPERVELEQSILGSAFVPAAPLWHADGDSAIVNPNLTRLRERVVELAGELHRRLGNGVSASADELADYSRLILYLLWLRYEDDWYELIVQPGAATRPQPFYERFAADVALLLSPVAGLNIDPAHLFALGFQIRRAFHHIFRKIFGASLLAAHLRARVWQSIFTRNAHRYRTALFERMSDVPTLILGASGTGKELVARAIALSQYIPFDPGARTFAADPAAGLCAVNLAALSPNVIESELFGHRRGAFTGAIEERSGWFEKCGTHGAVFLDEIGELDATIQVKLLRILQNREFQKLGATTTQMFHGKVIAATHRDLQAEMANGRFREDLYYRICADLIVMPTLREQLTAQPDDLSSLVLIVARRIVGVEEADAFSREALDWIVEHLGPDYPWLGNMRELEQCLRNVLVHGEYHPPQPRHQQSDSADALAAELRGGKLTADEIIARYCMLVYAQTRNLSETARRLGMTRATVRSKLNSAARWRGDAADDDDDSSDG